MFPDEGINSTPNELVGVYNSYFVDIVPVISKTFLPIPPPAIFKLNDDTENLNPKSGLGVGVEVGNSVGDGNVPFVIVIAPSLAPPFTFPFTSSTRKPILYVPGGIFVGVNALV